MVEYSTPHQALLTAVSIAGGQAPMARICGVSPQAVWKWLRSEKPLPAEQVLKVEAATGVSRHALRPDIYPLDHAATLSRRASAHPAHTFFPAGYGADAMSFGPIDQDYIRAIVREEIALDEMRRREAGSHSDRCCCSSGRAVPGRAVPGTENFTVPTSRT